MADRFYSEVKLMGLKHEFTVCISGLNEEWQLPFKLLMLFVSNHKRNHIRVLMRRDQVQF